MEEGTIARIMDKGYGFIKQEGRSKDLFFHASEVVNGAFNDLREGDKVTFEITEGNKGPQATKIARV